MPSKFSVMDFRNVAKLVDEILKTVPCPRCRKNLEGAGLDVLSADEESLAFQLACPSCGARLTMEGLLRHPSDAQHEQVTPPIVPVRVLSPESVRGISEQLHNFRGSDIRELLESN
jgi:hypothetical protein